MKNMEQLSKRTNLKKTVAYGVVIASLLTPAIAFAGTKTTSCYRGSVFMWSNDRVTFSYTGKKIISSYAHQSGGAIIPATMTYKGIRLVSNGSWSRSYQGQYLGGGGIPTPWGAANLVSQLKTMQTWIRGDGHWAAGWVS
ncbi:hypothetical protein ACFO26_01975 [Lactococcus nasutitermitis]|uniref:Uncharacterized protein n=1 Tax=Lactococcus nasutitermitis TaxID=1652957 RepID=A0ABV9JE67_9LACT|nr:hypothetical protein [Lactococcus nasutitermitis]